MCEQRGARRDQLVGPGVSCFTEVGDGTVLEGVVKDISDNGARISGVTTGLNVGDHLKVVFVVQSDQKVLYRGVIKHLDEGTEFFGFEFESEPVPVDGVDPAVKRCTYCNRKYTLDWNYCGTCGRELRADEVPHPEFGGAT